MATFKPPKPIPPEPEVDPGILRRAANAGLGGISALGNLLDLPGSMVRDTLSLRNPFDQLLSPLSPEGRTSGRDMLRSLGLAGKEDTWANLLPGMALEIATDPMTYLSLGTAAALKEGGKAAKAAGILHLAPEVATARELSAPTAQASKLMKAGNVLADAVRADQNNPLIKESMKRGAVPSGVPRSSVGPRVARTKLSLQDLVEGLPEKHSPANSIGVLREQAIKNISDYAQKVHKLDYDSYMAKHGQDALAGHVSYGVPFGKKNVANLPHWTKVDSINAHLDAAGEFLRWSAPGRAVAALFHAPAMGQTSYEGQKAAGRIYDARKFAVSRAAEELWQHGLAMDDLSKEFEKSFSGQSLRSPVAAVGVQPLGIDAKTSADAFRRLARYTYEISGPKRTMSNALSEASAAMLGSPTLGSKALHDNVAALLENVKSVKDRYHADLLDSGIDIGTIGNDLFSHLPRYVNPQNFDEYQKYISKLAPMSGLATKSRTSEIAQLPAEAVQWLVENPLLRDTSLPQNVREKLIEQAMSPYTAAMAEAPTSSDLLKWLSSTSDDFAFGKNPRRFYPNSPMKDLSDHMASAARITATRDAAFHTLLESIDHVSKNGALGSGLEKLDDVLTRMQFGDINKAKQRMAKMAGLSDFTKLDGAEVPSEVANALSSMMAKSTNPSVHGPMLFWFDKATQFLKTSLTLPWPAFSVRNSMSGQLWNLMSDALSDSEHYPKYFSNVVKARDVMRNPEKYRDLLAELDAHGVYRYGFNAADVPDKFGAGGITPPRLLSGSDIMATVDQEIKDTGRTFPEHALRQYPDAQAKASSVITPVRRGYGAAVEAGKRGAALGEWYNRVPMYMTLRDLGYAPEVAARKVAELHVDYSDLAPFEKDVMRRVVPFYSFMRKIGENMFRQIGENPGGVTSVAGTIKNMNRMRSPGELLPDYVAETASIPLGGDSQGNRSYITGFGLPFEDPLSFFGKGARGALLEGLSRLNPMLKAPLEYATGELFFQAGPGGGRDLADADPLLGRTISNIAGWQDAVQLPQAVEVGLANSPLSRVISTTRQLFDPRKSLLTKAANLTSGVRISTISPAAGDALLRDAVQDELRNVGSRQFVRSYIPESRKANMTPDQLQHATRLEGALNTLAKRAKRRKELQEAAIQ